MTFEPPLYLVTVAGDITYHVNLVPLTEKSDYCKYSGLTTIVVDGSIGKNFEITLVKYYIRLHDKIKCREIKCEYLEQRYNI